MKHLTLLLCLLANGIPTMAQFLKIEYEFLQNNKEHSALSLHENYVSRISPTHAMTERVDKQSVGKVDGVKMTENTESVTKKLSSDYIVVTSKRNIFYKNYITDSITYSAFIITKQVIVSEKLDKFEWEILDKDTVYLDMKCKIATTQHRGHTWTAFFTDRFGLHGGPWKLDGLPGLILHAATEGNEFVFNTLKIEAFAKNEEIVNPFYQQKTMSWEEYTKTYKERLLNQVKKLNSMNDHGEKDSVVRLGTMIEYLGFTEVRQ